jgi:hypothetical protein
MRLERQLVSSPCHGSSMSYAPILHPYGVVVRTASVFLTYGNTKFVGHLTETQSIGTADFG